MGGLWTEDINETLLLSTNAAETVNFRKTETLFRGLTFALFGLSENITLQLTSYINVTGGTTAEQNDFSKTVDYLVVPVITDDLSNVHSFCNAKETVTDLWIDNCLGDNNIVAIEYYHRTISLTKAKNPLQGLNFVFSTYTGPERDYLHYLAGALGGEVNDRYVRNERPILICPTPDGKKYLGAIKWKLPAVSCEWLRKCYELDEKVPMCQYAVGESKCSDGHQDYYQDDQIVNSGSGVIDHQTQKTELTPETTKIVYDSYKSTKEKEAPLTKRRGVVMDPADGFDRNYVEMSKDRTGTQFVKHRRRMYRELLGDTLASSSASSIAPSSFASTTPSSFSSITSSSALSSFASSASLTTSNLTNVDADRNETERIEDGSTQVQEFFDSIKKCRDSCPSRAKHPSTIIVIDSSSDDEMETENATPPPQQQQSEIIDWLDPDDSFPSKGFFNGSRSTFKGEMCFAMSLAIDVAAQILTKQIKELGGKVCEESTEFNPSCTHLICSKPNLGEKTLSVIASGRWLLCLAYVEDSCKAGHFLNEEDYEWGNPRAKSKLPEGDNVRSNNLASVSYKWRRELQLRSEKENKPVGVFTIQPKNNLVSTLII